jgi:uncharacterized protein (UPF0333 family)
MLLPLLSQRTYFLSFISLISLLLVLSLLSVVQIIIIIAIIIMLYCIISSTDEGEAVAHSRVARSYP